MAAAADPSHLSSLELRKSLGLASRIIFTGNHLQIAATAYSGARHAEPPALGALHCDPSHLISLESRKSLGLVRRIIFSGNHLRIAARAYSGARHAEPPAFGSLQSRLPIPPPPAAVPVPLHEEENRLGNNLLDFSHDPFFKGLLTDRDKRERILPVRHQGKTNACFAVAVVNSVAGVVQGCRGSEQELLDRMTSSLRESSVVPIIDLDKWLPCDFPRAFEYILTQDLHLERDYKWVGKYQPHPPNNLPLNPEKIYITEYRKIDSENTKLVIEQLIKQPLVGGIVTTSGFYNWGPEDSLNAFAYVVVDFVRK